MYNFLFNNQSGWDSTASRYWPVFTTENYDALLNGWASLAQIPTPSSQVAVQGFFHGGYTQYSAAGQAARNTLINTYGWTINDGGRG
jgi:hypothetical protein